MAQPYNKNFKVWLIFEQKLKTWLNLNLVSPEIWLKQKLKQFNCKIEKIQNLS